MAEYIVRETTYDDATKQEVVRELVRCKDCKWYSPMSPMTEGFLYCDKNGLVFYLDDFCSRAERRRA